MPYSLCPYAIVHIINAGIAFTLSLAALPLGKGGHNDRAARLLGVFSLLLGLWILTTGIEAAAVSPSTKFFWAPLEYLFNQTAILVFLLFSLAFTKPHCRVAPVKAAVLAVPTAAAIAIVFSNPLHGLLWTGYETGPAGTNSILFSNGPLFGPILLLDIVYSGYSAYLFLAAAIRSRGRFRVQCVSMIAAIFAVWLFAIPYALGISPFPGLDMTPVGFLAADSIMIVLLFRGGFLDIVPIAREWVIDQMADPFIVLDSRNVILDANRAARDALLIPDSGIGGKAYFPESWRKALEDPGPSSRPRVIAIEERSGPRAGKRWYELIRQSIDLGPGRGGARVILVHDVTSIASKGERLREAFTKLDRSYGRAKASEKEFRELANRDPLTSLRNRRYLEENMDDLALGAKLAGYPLSVAMIDVDRFKDVNDKYGHDAGDRVLKELGGFLRKSVRTTDVAARYGGEEFILVFSRLGGEAAARKVGGILASFSEIVFSSGGRPFKVTFSSGVAELDAEREVMPALIKRADKALYRAKHSGRNRVVLAGRG